MSPPCGRHILFFPPCMSVRASVRASVRPFVCNAFLSEPYLQEPFVQKNLQKIPKITYLLKLLAKKPLFEFSFCPGQISVTIHPRIAGVFCVSEDIPIVQRRSQFFKMLDFGSFFGNFRNFGFKNCLISYIIAHAKFHSFDHQF